MTGAFRRRDAAARREAFVPPNTTPMADAILVILVFFLTGSAIILPRAVIPAAARAGPDGGASPFSTDTPPIRLTLQADPARGAVVLGLGEPVPIADLRSALAARARDANIVVEAQPGVTHQELVWALDAARAAGARSVSIALPEG